MKKNLNHQIELFVEAETSHSIVDGIIPCSKQALNQIYNKPICLSINVASSAQIKKLNSEFRNINKDTNVLSFPDEWPKELVAAKGFYFIGDIVICPEVLKAESLMQNKPLINHWKHMLTHGILHLAGYDHIEEDDAVKMEQLEIEILASMNVPNPYLEID